MKITPRRVEVYWNLHKNCYSVRALSGPDKGRVIAHVPSISLTGAEFAVQPAGRRKVLRENRKNVHAFVRGWTQFRPDGTTRKVSVAPWDATTRVTYNPYKFETFVTVGGHTPVTYARKAWLETGPVSKRPHMEATVDV